MSRIYNFYLKVVFKKLVIINQTNFQGVPFFNVKGKMFIDEGVTFVSSHFFNPVGLSKRCGIFVSENGFISIGKNSGLSGVTLVSWNKIVIGENCGIGGNVSIWDTDFHGIHYQDRTCFEKIKTEPVIIGNNVWVGANVIILKGTEIGNNSVIGAGSVVVGSKIKDNEIWAGNPAKFIKIID